MLWKFEVVVVGSGLSVRAIRRGFADNRELRTDNLTPLAVVSLRVEYLVRHELPAEDFVTRRLGA